MAANERKETRALHNRPDYPLTDPMLDGKALYVRKINGTPTFEWRKTE
jgi:succinate dehydrogenase/fumarate reductase flavoprotein subunit